MKPIAEKLVDKFDLAYHRAKAPLEIRKAARVMNEHGVVTITGSAKAVDEHIAFVKRNRGK